MMGGKSSTYRQKETYIYMYMYIYIYTHTHTHTHTHIILVENHSGNLDVMRAQFKHGSSTNDVWRCGLDSSDSRQQSAMGSGADSIETSVSIKVEQFTHLWFGNIT